MSLATSPIASAVTVATSYVEPRHDEQLNTTGHVYAKRRDLLAAVEVASKACRNTPSRPWNALLQLTTDGAGSLVVTADACELLHTGLTAPVDVAVSLTVGPVEVAAPLSCVVNAFAFAKALKASKRDNVTLATGEPLAAAGLRVLRVYTESGAIDVATHDNAIGAAGRFEPVRAGGDWLGAFNAPANMLADGLALCVKETDESTTRYNLGGVLLDVGPWRSGAGIPGLQMVATDGRRLHATAFPDTVSVDDAEGFGVTVSTQEGDFLPIIHARGVAVLRAMLAKRGAELVTVARAGHCLQFSADNAICVVRCHYGRFPRWRDVVPSRSDAYRATVSVSNLTAAMKDAKAATSEDNRGADMTFGGDALAVEVNATTDNVTSRVYGGIVPAVTPPGAVDITLDPRFVLDFLSTLDKRGTVEIELVDADSCAVLRCGSALCLVMPLARDRK